MNWTGGSLQRTKHANKGVVQRQRAYFACARTRLQNNSQSPVATFLPSYFCNNGDGDGDPGKQVPIFELGSVRRTGHPCKQPCEEVGHEASLRNKRHHQGDEDLDQEALNRMSRHAILRPGLLVDDRNAIRGGKWTTKTQTSLLEANKERLLRQQDWIGIVSSKPVDLHFSSSRESGRIGKRRKARAKCLADTRRNSNPKITGGLLQPTNDDCALGNDDGSVRIRIGTDALTTTYSIQSHDHVQSQALSDPMLFDHEPRCAAQQKESQDARVALFEPSMPARGFRSSVDYKRRWPGKPIRLYEGDVWRHDMDHSSQQPNLGHGGNNNQAELTMAGHHVSGVETMDTENEAFAPDCRMMHHVEGIERALHLMFGDSSRRADACSRIKSQEESVGEGEDTRKADPAVSSRSGYVHQVNNGSRRQVVDEGSTIKEGEAQKPCVTFSDASSGPTTAARRLETRLLHSYPTARNNGAGPVSWSQHAEQGDFTHVSSISASSPCLRRPREKFAVRQAAPCNMDEDEKTWQKFVLGSDEELGSETTSEHQGDSDQKTFKTSQGFSPPPLLVSSPPMAFKLRSGMEACISDNAHDTAKAFAPPSGTRSITPRFHGCNEDVGEGELSMASDEESVNGKCVQSNASCDTDAVSLMRLREATMIDCSLSGRDDTLDGQSTRATTGTSGQGRVKHSPCSPVMLGSNDGIDLIDPDKLW